MALGAEHEEAAGGQRFFPPPGDLGLELAPLDLLVLQGRLDAQALLLRAPADEAHVDVAAELDVGAAAGHVGGDGDRAGHAGVGDDVGLLLMVTGVEHLVRNPGAALAGGVVEPVLLQGLGEHLRLLDRHRAHQHRLAALVAVLDLGDDRRLFFGSGAVDLVVLVQADHRHVGGDLGHVHLVDVEEFLGFGGRRAGHSRELLVEAEVVLDGHRGQGLVLGLDIDPFLGLDGLVQAFRQAPAVHHAAGELVDQHHLAVAHDVVTVAQVHDVGPEGLIDVVDHRDVGRVVEAGGAVLQMSGGLQDLLDLLRAFFGQQHLALLLVVLEGLRILHQLPDQGVDGPVEVRAVLGRAADDQRCPRLIDQDRVHLVDDGEVVAALDHLADVVGEVVSQVVEAELVVGAIGDVAAVGALALALRQAVDDHPHRHAEEAVDPAHPFGVQGRQIVVDRDQVRAIAGEPVQIQRQGGDQGFALAGLHFGDAAFVQDDAADHLDVEMALADGPLGRLADHREGLVHQIIEALAGGEPGLEFVGLGTQRLVRKRRHRRLQGGYPGHPAKHAP